MSGGEGGDSGEANLIIISVKGESLAVHPIDAGGVGIGEAGQGPELVSGGFEDVRAGAFIQRNPDIVRLELIGHFNGPAHCVEAIGDRVVKGIRGEDGPVGCVEDSSGNDTGGAENGRRHRGDA